MCSVCLGWWVDPNLGGQRRWLRRFLNKAFGKAARILEGTEAVTELRPVLKVFDLSENGLPSETCGGCGLGRAEFGKHEGHWLGGRHHPADDITAEHVEDHIEIVVQPPDADNRTSCGVGG